MLHAVTQLTYKYKIQRWCKIKTTENSKSGAEGEGKRFKKQ